MKSTDPPVHRSLCKARSPPLFFMGSIQQAEERHPSRLPAERPRLSMIRDRMRLLDEVSSGYRSLLSGDVEMLAGACQLIGFVPSSKVHPLCCAAPCLSSACRKARLQSSSACEPRIWSFLLAAMGNPLSRIHTYCVPSENYPWVHGAGSES